MLLWNWIAFFLRAFVAALFLLLMHAANCSISPNLPQLFAVIASFQISFSGIAAKVLSVVELALGLLFLFNIFPLIVGLAISILLVIFSGILLRARFMPDLGIQDCGCSGVNKKKTPIGKALFRNVLLISASVVIIAVVGMHRNISLSLSPLIEVILLVCILTGMLCIRIGLFSSLLNVLNVETITREGSTSTVTEGNRRSFIKWGIAGIIGLSAFLSVTPITSAALYTPCDSGECGCNPGEYEYDQCGDGMLTSDVFRIEYLQCCNPTSKVRVCENTTTKIGTVKCRGC